MRRRRSPAIARARLIVDLDAIVANWRALDARTAPSVETAAVVKADAYGLGAAVVARSLADAGARSFFVALAEEGAALRAALGSGPDIYVLSGLMPGDVALFRENRLVPCLNSPGQVEAFVASLAGRPFALQIDTGMNRLGIEPDEIARVRARLGPLSAVLVLSHLACADEPDHPLNAAQRTAFDAARAALPPARASLSATGGLLLGTAFHADLVRPGIGLYGGLPFSGARPVVTLSLPVIQMRDVAPGESVGYGATWTAAAPARVATVAAGYADGLVRRIDPTGACLFAGDRACPIVGRISMDLITVDVTGLPEVPEALEILSARQTIDDLASAAGTIGYEILTGLGGRLERVYKSGAPSQGHDFQPA